MALVKYLMLFFSNFLFTPCQNTALSRFIKDFLGNFRSTVLLVSFAPGFVSLPCITQSSAALETLRPAQNILRNTALLRFPRKSNIRSACIFTQTGGV